MKGEMNLLQFKGEIVNVESSIADKTVKITYRIDNFADLISEVVNLIGKVKNIIFKDVKRSRDANAYFWLLCGQLAAKLQQPREEIYINYIKDIGDNYDIVPIRNDAVLRWITNWQNKGIGWVCEVIGSSKIDGYSNCICYYGSSLYDSSQMSRLIDMVVADCKDNGIDTATPEEINKMKSLWNKEN